MSSPTILIVGAGPVGLCLACELARYGVPFRLIEKRPQASQTSKALGIHARSLEMLEDMGLAQRFIERGLPVHRMNFYAEGKQLTHINLSEVDSPFNFTLDLPQNLTEALFIERLAELGHEVERYVELVDIDQDDKQVSVELLKKGGVKEKKSYQYVVGCDGAHSSVRKHLNIAFDGEAYPEHFALADVHIDSAMAPNEMHMFFHGDGFLILFPMVNQRFRVIATVNEAAEPELDEAFFQQLMDVRTKQQSHVSDGIWFSNFRIHHRIVTEYRHDRIFLAGDSAHIHSPAGGQGMNTGMQDAYNLAWKLALQHEDKGDLLESYSLERQPVGRGVVEMTDRMTKVATMQNPIGTAIRNRLLPVAASLGVVQHKMVDSMEEVDVSYRKTNWVEEYVGPTANSTRSPFGQGPHAGDRAPDATITHSQNGNPVRLFDLFKGPHYTLLIFTYSDASDEELAQISQTVKQCEARLGKWINCVYVSGRNFPTLLKGSEHAYLDARLTAHKNYGLSNQAQALYLIRPDGYVAFRSLPLNGDKLCAYLDRIQVG